MVPFNQNIQPEQKEETRIQKNEERLRNLQDIFKCSNIRIIGVSEGEEEGQEIEKLFENIMENFPNLAKEIDFQEVQEAQRSPKRHLVDAVRQQSSTLSAPGTASVEVGGAVYKQEVELRR